MSNATAQRADPDAAVLIAQDLARQGGPERAGQLVRLLKLAAHQPVDSSRLHDEQDTVCILSQRLNGLIGLERIEDRLTLIPLPQSLRFREPQVSSPVLVHRPDIWAEPAFFAHALHAPVPNGAHAPVRWEYADDPYRPLAIFEEREHPSLLHFGIAGKMTVLPARESS